MSKRIRKSDGNTFKVKGAVIFGATLAFVLMILLSTVGKKEFTTPHKFVLEAVGVLQSGLDRLSSLGRDTWEGYIALWDVREENNLLQTEIDRLKAINNTYREAAATNIRLEKLLQVKEALPPPTITARVIGRDPSLWFKTLIINRGATDGIRKGMPVMTVEGIAGQIMDTSPNYSKVLLAIDPNSAIDVLVQRTRVQGIIKGTGDGYELHYVLKNSDVQQYDRVITSGLAGYFPKGLTIGTVKDVTLNRHGIFQKITVTPTVDFTRLEDLIIIMSEASLAE